jgi:hypothetical protein
VISRFGLIFPVLSAAQSLISVQVQLLLLFLFMRVFICRRPVGVCYRGVATMGAQHGQTSSAGAVPVFSSSDFISPQSVGSPVCRQNSPRQHFSSIEIRSLPDLKVLDFLLVQVLPNNDFPLAMA